MVPNNRVVSLKFFEEKSLLHVHFFYLHEFKMSQPT